MRPRRVAAGLSVCLALLLLLAPGAGAKAERWTTYERPPTHELAAETNVPIEMSDGVVLRANVLRPATEGRFPVLIVQTPYNKDAGIGAFLGGTSSYFARRGYAMVITDVRGTGSSGGEWDSFGEREQRDGPEVVEWAARQPWSTGKVGLLGPSYMGFNQLQTAARRPPHLEAIFPIVPLADGYRDIVFSGGVVNVSFIPLWLGLVTAGGVTPVGAADDPLGAVTVLLSHLAGVVNFQVPSVLSSALGAELAFDGPFWKTRSPIELVDRIRVPAFVVGGHHDLFQRGTPLIYERLKRRVPTRLLMGPWTHIEGAGGAGLPADGVPDLDAIALRWFDRWLLGRKTKVGRMPRVTQYVYGPDRYRTQADWPDPRLDPRRLYLRGGGGLAPSRPGGGERSQAFSQDPVAGICTLSTSQWTAGIGDALPCTTDRTDDERGVASYTTAPMRRPLEISGPILANLWVRTTARDAVLTVRVKDVAPDGEVTDLTTGWLSASLRAVDESRSRFVRERRADGSPGPRRLLQPWHPFTRESVEPVRPGQRLELPIEVFPTRATIRRGHRLKLTVSGGDFPHQVPPLPKFLDSLAGRVAVLNEPGHASYLEIPGLARRCGGCDRLPIPRLIRGR